MKRLLIGLALCLGLVSCAAPQPAASTSNSLVTRGSCENNRLKLEADNSYDASIGYTVTTGNGSKLETVSPKSIKDSNKVFGFFNGNGVVIGKFWFDKGQMKSEHALPKDTKLVTVAFTDNKSLQIECENDTPNN